MICGRIKYEAFIAVAGALEVRRNDDETLLAYMYAADIRPRDAADSVGGRKKCGHLSVGWHRQIRCNFIANVAVGIRRYGKCTHAHQYGLIESEMAILEVPAPLFLSSPPPPPLHPLPHPSLVHLSSCRADGKCAKKRFFRR